MKEKSVWLPLVSLWPRTEIGAQESEPAHLMVMEGEGNIAYDPTSESGIQEWDVPYSVYARLILQKSKSAKSKANLIT